MKKTGLFLLLLLAVAASAQDKDAMAAANSADQAPTPSGTAFTTVGFPTERVQTPTNADLYCAGFIGKELPNANFVAGGLQTPNTTKFVNGDMVYLAGGGYQTGQEVHRILSDGHPAYRPREFPLPSRRPSCLSAGAILAIP